MSVEISFPNLDSFIAGLEKRVEKGVEPAVNEAAARIQSKFTQNPAGWMPLAQATILDRRRRGYGAGPMLFRTGHLKGESVQKIEINGLSGVISTGDKIAAIQNQTRPFYQFTPEDKEAIFKAFMAGLKG